MLTDRLIQRLEALEARSQEIEGLLGQPEVAADFQRTGELARERAGSQEAVQLYRRYRALLHELQEARELLSGEAEEGMAALVQEEVDRLAGEQEELQAQLQRALLPRDLADERDVIVEIRAGIGGEEAGLFAADLYRMYARYAQLRRWSVDVLSSSETGIGGFKEIVFEVQGRGAFSRLKHERGGHRVQRVPATESSGRIHTSTATVAVLPEAEEVEVAIDPKDLRVDIFHSGGPGGQNVNKVATAVRITHVPTGLVAVCQDERSQHKNRARAMAVLRARIQDLERQRQEEELSQARRSMVGSGERAEKVRTYNFPQNRVTDHRIGLTLHALDRVLEGDLDSLIEALVQADEAQALEEAAV
jgi:peptide chain release factor 1